MIGASLSERYGAALLPTDEAIAVLGAQLGPLAADLIAVRRRDPAMIACVILDADSAAVRLCERIGLAMKPGGTGVLGLLGADAVRLFPRLAHSPARKAWMETPCGEHETKVLLVRRGHALLSVETSGGRVAITAAP